LLGQVEQPQIDVEGIQRRLARPDYAHVAQSMRDVGFGSVLDLLATYAGQRQDLLPWLEGAQINRDGNLRLQYMAGLALNVSMEGTIYTQLLSYRRYPQNMLVVSEPNREMVMEAMRGPGGQ
jgi:spermidine synthase